MSDEPLLKVVGLSKYYGSRIGCVDVSFERRESRPEESERADWASRSRVVRELTATGRRLALALGSADRVCGRRKRCPDVASTLRDALGVDACHLRLRLVRRHDLPGDEVSRPLGVRSPSNFLQMSRLLLDRLATLSGSQDHRMPAASSADESERSRELESRRQ